MNLASKGLAGDHPEGVSNKPAKSLEPEQRSPPKVEVNYTPVYST